MSYNVKWPKAASTGIEEINKALTQMDEVTQQNSALVEENAATAKTLEQQARAMDERVAFFRLRAAGGPADVARPAARTEPASQQPQHDATAPRRPAAVPKRAAAPRRAAAGGGPVGQMQTALATAINRDQEWKEF